MQNMTLDVKGMTCNHCKSAVEGALKELDGIEQVEVNVETGKVDVTYDANQVTKETMRKAIEDQGYDVA
ncbi:MAG TPA: copper chaperone CopZ [Bacillota bacterium]|nr:copper chaperone CopZ [Bacillota bacterium]